jgi:uncharacterized membrane protein YeaQ/YmgE (transglycosylase-associated protein family)
MNAEFFYGACLMTLLVIGIAGLAAQDFLPERWRWRVGFGRALIVAAISTAFVGLVIVFWLAAYGRAPGQ